MSFVMSPENLQLLANFKPQFYDGENMSVFWETTPEVVAKLLPPPLKPAEMPLVWAYVASFQKTNFNCSYNEAALLLACEFDGELGFHVISMPVTDDMAMVGGRERFGYPKKIAQVSLTSGDGTVEGWVERHGIRIFQLNATLGGKPNAADAAAVMGQFVQPPIKIFLFKCFGAPGEGFDYNPRLVRQEINSETKQMDVAEAEVTLTPSNDDPWAEVEVMRVIGGLHLISDSTMEPGTVVAEVDPAEYAPYAFSKIDPMF